jgi:response regulator of citrate/malate metabolism
VTTAIRVLVVEDDQFLASAHQELVGRVEGFEVIGVAGSGGEALRFLAAREVDLVLLDIYLPDMTGLDVVRALRAKGLATDVIAVTSARDLDVVRAAVSQGVVQYLLKPFTFASLRGKLEQYAAYRAQLDGAGEAVVQDEVDELLGLLRATGVGTALPKGMSAETMRRVADHLRDAGAASASEVAESTGTSRVTARRYLEHLAETGVVERRPRYGGGGRPEMEYRWLRRSYDGLE